MTDLSNSGATVLHGVDATSLEDHQVLSEKVFHRVIFNFPHVEGSLQEDVDRNKDLLTEFFRSVPQVLVKNGGESGEERGEAHVTLRRTQFYDSWGIESLANEVGLELVREVPFVAKHFMGYECKRTAGEKVREAPSTDGATTYVFVVPEAEAAAKRGKSSSKRKGSAGRGKGSQDKEDSAASSSVVTAARRDTREKIIEDNIEEWRTLFAKNKKIPKRMKAFCVAHKVSKSEALVMIAPPTS